MTKNHIKEMVETDIKFLREFYSSLDVEKRKLTGFSPSKLTIMLEKNLIITLIILVELNFLIKIKKKRKNILSTV